MISGEQTPRTDYRKLRGVLEKAPPAQRFWLKVEKTEACWIWTGARSRGYGLTSDGQRQVKAHRFSYELCVGSIPPGFEIDHLCCNTSCVRPDHLEAVTAAENLRRSHEARKTQQGKARKAAILDARKAPRTEKWAAWARGDAKSDAAATTAEAQS